MPGIIMPFNLAIDILCFYQGPAAVISSNKTPPTWGLQAFCTHSHVPTVALNTLCFMY